jgi:uncharacterized membrane protein YwzB
MFRINSFIKKKAYCQINLSFLFFVITGKVITNFKFAIMIKKKKKKKRRRRKEPIDMKNTLDLPI